MNTRLQQFLLAENISQSQFADIIGVARASVSHILAGRNKPGYEFILGMTTQFPSLNIDWLLTGKGKMYRQESRNDQGPAYTAPVQPAEKPEYQTKAVLTSESVKNAGAQEYLFPVEEEEQPAPAETPAASPSKPQKSRRIKKVVIFYEDSTFEEIGG